MSKIDDYEIKKGVLFKYRGNDANITIPDGVISIKKTAFSGCVGLTSIIIPDSVTSIAEQAFAECVSLISVTIPSSVSNIGNVFAHCKSLISIIIPDSVTSIGAFAFFGCSSLTSVAIPESVTSIDKSAFYGCSSLASITIPNSVTIIDRAAFRGCSSLTSVTIPGSVTSIGEEAFFGCSSLTSITIPNNVTSIRAGAFRGCTNLTSMIIPDSVTEISEHTFSECSSLTCVTIPNGVTSIGVGSFNGCKSITSIIIPDSVTSIGEHAFSGCSSLKSLRFNNIIEQSKIILPPELFTFIIDCQKKEALPTLLMYQAGKEWQDNFYSAIDKSNAYYVIKECIGIINSMSEISSDQAEKVLEIAVAYHNNIGSESLKELAVTLNRLKFANLSLDRILNDLNKYDNSVVEQDTQSLFDALEKIADYYDVNCAEYPKAASYVKAGLRYKNSDKCCTSKLLTVLVCEFIKKWNLESTKIQGEISTVNVLSNAPSAYFSPIVNQIVNGIETEDLISFLMSKVGGKDYRYFIIALAKYGDEKDISWFISSINNDKKGNAQAKYRAKSSEYALLISNTKAAVLYFEKNKRIDEYAILRNTTGEELRIKYLYNFGFDKNGVKTYDLGKKKVELKLNSDLSLTLFDIDTGKEVKSIPKRDSDTAKYEAAIKDFADMKSTIKRIVKSIIDRLFAEFLSKRKYSSSEWVSYFNLNPVLKNIAKLIVWSQGKTSFAVVSSGYVDCDGNPYEITSDEIIIAHPMEMTSETTGKWQKYFIFQNLKQPFDQIWEPVINFDSFNPKSFDGCEMPLFRFNGQEKHGIVFNACSEYNYRLGHYEYTDLDILLSYCTVDWELTSGNISNASKQSMLTLKSFRYSSINRESNHIIVYLNKCTIYGRIAKDDDSVIDNLDCFTVAQINTFLKFAIEKNATKCTAAFLDYKNEHFADFAPIDEFTLDFPVEQND